VITSAALAFMCPVCGGNFQTELRLSLWSKRVKCSGFQCVTGSSSNYLPIGLNYIFDMVKKLILTYNPL
jgi:hypothetical protein